MDDRGKNVVMVRQYLCSSTDFAVICLLDDGGTT